MRLFNLLQFLPGGWWITHEGVKANRYPDFGPADEATAQTAASQVSAEWEAAMELTAAELHEAMKQWAASSLPAPQLGYELADSTGSVLAEAELAWPKQRLTVLHGEQTDAAVAFKAAGWRVYSAADCGELAERVAADLAA